MCFFNYYQCDNCRYPDTSILYLASECSAFLTNVNNGTLPTRAAVLDLQRKYATSAYVSPWEFHGQQTVARDLKDKLRPRDVPALLWEILPERICVRFTPVSTKWVCDECQKALAGDASSQRFVDAGEQVPKEMVGDVPQAHMLPQKEPDPLSLDLTVPGEEGEVPERPSDTAELEGDNPSD